MGKGGEKRLKQWLATGAIGGVPRWFILLALLTFCIATGVGQWMVFYLYPARLGIINILAGLALAGGGLYPWLLASEYGIWEVYEMVLSRSIRRREEERAAAERAEKEAKRAAAAERAAERAAAAAERAAAAAERVAEAEESRAAAAAERAAAAAERVAEAEERRAAERAAAERVAEAEERRAAALEEWYEQHKEQLYNVPPPPGIARDDHSNGAG